MPDICTLVVVSWPASVGLDVLPFQPNNIKTAHIDFIIGKTLFLKYSNELGIIGLYCYACANDSWLVAYDLNGNPIQIINPEPVN